MPVTAIPNSGSQIDRSICAYLISGGCGDSTNVLPSHSVQAKSYPNVTVKAFQMTDAESAVGNEVWQVQIQIKASAANAAGETNPDNKRVVFDQLCGLVWALMQQSDDGSSLDATAAAITAAGRALKTATGTLPKTWAHPDNNADMDQFTCKHIYRKSGARGEPNEDGSSWAEVRTYEVHAIPDICD